MDSLWSSQVDTEKLTIAVVKVTGETQDWRSQGWFYTQTYIQIVALLCDLKQLI
jgi:hypothetical protein